VDERAGLDAEHGGDPGPASPGETAGEDEYRTRTRYDDQRHGDSDEGYELRLIEH
jgi:hypothetical protein